LWPDAAAAAAAVVVVVDDDDLLLRDCLKNCASMLVLRGGKSR
jgi:hypothetical protein